MNNSTKSRVNSLEESSILSSTNYRSPFHILILIAISIFVAEIIVMIFIHLLPPFPTHVIILFDAALLITLLSPSLYFFLFRPLLQYIADRELIEKKLRESEKDLSTLMRNIPGVVYRCLNDRQWTIKFVSEGCFDLYGYHANEFFGEAPRSFAGLTHPADREQVWELTQNALRKHHSYYLQYRIVTKGQKIKWVQEQGRGIYSDTDELLYLEGVCTDITKIKEAEEKRAVLEAQLLQAHKMEAVGTLAGGIAHDFNNLLSVILVNLSLADEDIKPEVGRSNFLKEAEKASLRAKDLAARLITFSKGGAPVKKVTSIGKLVKDSVISSTSGSDIGCEFSIADDLSIVEIDEAQMKQAIHNIAVNAQEAMSGKGAIQIYGENVLIGETDNLTLKNGKYVKITITDQGIGIPEENLTKIFDPYFSTKEMGADKGMGLGLSICHSIVEKHGGLITVESELGIGTVFFIYLPASEKAIAKLEPEREFEPEIPATGTGKVLLMDDEKMIRNFAIRVLNRIGYESEVSIDGAEAIELYKKAKESGDPFDAVILDLTNQFGMGGKEAIEKLIEIDPDVKGIVSTGYSDDPVVTNFKKYGFCGTLTKPYSIDELSKALSDVISREKKSNPELAQK